MSQRYFLVAESAYETLRNELNDTLGYPTATAVSPLASPLHAPRDGIHRIVLAVDDALPSYSQIITTITTLVAKEYAEELTEAQYLAALAVPSAGVSTWNDLLGKPTSFTPSSHASSHAAAGTDPLSLSGAQITSGTVNELRLPVTLHPFLLAGM